MSTGFRKPGCFIAVDGESAYIAVEIVVACGGAECNAFDDVLFGGTRDGERVALVEAEVGVTAGEGQQTGLVAFACSGADGEGYNTAGEGHTGDVNTLTCFGGSERC